MLAHCQGFTVSGGTFNIFRRDVARDSRQPSETFRRLRLGDLNLLEEVASGDIVEYREVRRRKKKRAALQRRHVVVGTRKTFRAKLFDQPGELTAVIPQGCDEEKLNAEIAKHEQIRHPSLVQLYAIAVGREQCALVYTDTLLSLVQIREMHAASPLASTYTEYGIKRDLRTAFKYWESVTGIWLLAPRAPGYTAWIRSSTGRLCIDVGDSKSTIKHLDVKSLARDPISRTVSVGYSDASLEQTLNSRLSVDDIHVILASANYQLTEVNFRTGRVVLGTIWPHSDVAKVAAPTTQALGFPRPLTPQDIVFQPWRYWRNGLRTPLCSKQDVMPNGWTKVPLPANMHRDFHLTTRIQIEPCMERELSKCWLSQAEAVSAENGFEKIGLTALCDHFIPGGVKFRVSIWYDNLTLRGTFMADTPPSNIYLFLFRPRLRWIGGYPSIDMPKVSDAFYWSLDPRGKTRLTQEMAEDLGAPHVFFECWVMGVSWTQQDYAMLSTFHRAKGFDSKTRDVAKKLGYSLLGSDTPPRTILSNIDQSALESAKSALATYPQPKSSLRCKDCGGRHPAAGDIVLPDIEVPPIHRHRRYRNVFVRASWK